MEEPAKSQSFTLSNRGTGDLSAGQTGLFGPDSAEFRILYDTCSQSTLAPGNKCTFQAEFVPASIGQKTAIFAIPSNDADTPVLNLPLRGWGCRGCCYHAVRIWGPRYFSTLQEACDAAQNDDIIQAHAAGFGALDFDLPVSVSLTGGYECEYDTTVGQTVIDKRMTISRGTVTVKNVLIK